MKCHSIRRMSVAIAIALFATEPLLAGPPAQSVAHEWSEEMLEAIRHDFARPVVHARNLFHVSVAMYDAWAAYDPLADSYISAETQTAPDIELARAEAVSFAAYRVLKSRFASSPGAATTIPALDAKFDELAAALSFGNDRTFTSIVGNSPAAIGNRCAFNVHIAFINDGANQSGGYANLVYEPINPPLLPDFEGNPDILDTNRWQPLALEYFIDQSGNPVPLGYPEFLGPEWGAVTPFALSPDDLTLHNRDGYDYWVYLDPGTPPQHGGVGDDLYKQNFALVSVWSSHLDPTDGVMIDVSPASIGNVALPTWPADFSAFYDLFNGGDWGTGYAVNPSTSLPYPAQIVPRGDYARILAEFWADGPNSETPPGHWFVLLNYVSDQLAEKRLGGTGPVLNDLEWDVKTYLAMGGAMHDAAVASWGVKGWYDYIRPVSAIRALADLGQSSDPGGPSYHPGGIPLQPGYIEVITNATILPGERHEHLAGKLNENVGKIAVFAWRGPDYIVDPDTDDAGVGWILAGNWWPYQRPTFVSPPFAGYVSGHSTYSRAAAELMTLITNDPYFPGGVGEFLCPANEYLVFEEGPSVDVTLQWATYRDASDQCSLSHIWGGIHPPADDIPGRYMGQVIGPEAYRHARDYFNGWISCPSDLSLNRNTDFADLLAIIAAWGPCADCPQDLNGNGLVDFADILEVIALWGPCP